VASARSQPGPGRTSVELGAQQSVTDVGELDRLPDGGGTVERFGRPGVREAFERDHVAVRRKRPVA